MIRLMVFLALGAFVFPAGANFNAGIGVWGGAQGCGGMSLPEGIQEVQDQIDEANQQIREQRRELSELKRKKRELEYQSRNAQRAIEGVLLPQVAQAVMQHIRGGLEGGQKLDLCATENERKADGYDANNKGFKSADAKVRVPAALQGAFCDEKQNNLISDWISFTDIGGQTKPDICNAANLVNEIYRSSSNVSAGARPAQARCETAINDFRTAENELKNGYTDAEVARREAQIKADQKYVRDVLRKDRTEAYRQYREDVRNGDIDESTEASDGGCTTGDCGINRYRGRNSISATDKVLSIAAGLGGAYLAYRGGKYITDQNAGLGYQTSPYLAYAMGAPYLMAGIYGAVYGGSGGAMGCAGGAAGPYGMYGPGGLYGNGMYPNAGGAFGYPPGWYDPLGGGMYNPGMTPGGIPGPWGMGYPWGGGVPMAGFIASAIGGAIAGPITPYYGMYGPISGMIASGIAGAIGGGIVPIGGGLYAPIAPIGGGLFAPIGGAAGGLFAPIGGGMYAPFAPIGGGAIATAIGGGIVPIAGGIYAPLAGGIASAIGGLFAPIGGGIAPIGGGIVPIGGGIGALGGALGGALSGQTLQYQQALMQQYQAQLNSWIQQQQAQQQDVMARTQMISRLQEQLVQIQYQIQAISTSSGYYGVGASTGGLGVGGFNGSILPLPQDGTRGRFQPK